MNAMTRSSWWLWLSLPISILALASSAAGIFDERTYLRAVGSRALASSRLVA